MLNDFLKKVSKDPYMDEDDYKHIAMKIKEIKEITDTSLKAFTIQIILSAVITKAITDDINFSRAFTNINREQLTEFLIEKINKQIEFDKIIDHIKNFMLKVIGDTDE